MVWKWKLSPCSPSLLHYRWFCGQQCAGTASYFLHQSFLINSKANRFSVFCQQRTGCSWAIRQLCIILFYKNADSREQIANKMVTFIVQSGVSMISEIQRLFKTSLFERDSTAKGHMRPNDRQVTFSYWSPFKQLNDRLRPKICFVRSSRLHSRLVSVRSSVIGDFAVRFSYFLRIGSRLQHQFMARAFGWQI